MLSEIVHWCYKKSKHLGMTVALGVVAWHIYNYVDDELFEEKSLQCQEKILNILNDQTSNSGIDEKLVYGNNQEKQIADKDSESKILIEYMPKEDLKEDQLKQESLDDKITVYAPQDNRGNYMKIKELLVPENNHYYKSIILKYNNNEQEFFFDNKDTYDNIIEKLDCLKENKRFFYLSKKMLLFIDDSLTSNYSGESYCITQEDIKRYEEKIESKEIMGFQ